MPLQIVIVLEPSLNRNYATLHFSVCLHKAGTDRDVYKNKWDNPSHPFEFHNSDSPLLREVLSTLMSDDSGVTQVHINPYSLNIFRSLAVSLDEIMQLVTDASFRAGFVAAPPQQAPKKNRWGRKNRS